MIKEIKSRTGEFTLLYPIYKGKNSYVYKVLDENSKKIYAGKRIERKNLNEKRKTNYFYCEYLLYHTISFENIIHLEKEMVQTKNNYYFLLEYCNGKSLAHFMKEYEKRNKEKLNEFYIKKILHQIINGLSYLHSSYFIHRDIKLQNIFINFDDFQATEKEEDYSQFNLDQKFTIKIGDFGFSKFLPKGDLTNSKVGTYFTAAPEVINSNGKGYNEKADLWSLGAITYDLIIGYDHNNEEIINKLEKGIFYIPNHKKISLEILSFIYGLLQPNPVNRFDWAKIKSHPFIIYDEKNFKYINIETNNNEDFEIDCNINLNLIMEKINLHKDYHIWEVEKINEKLIKENESLKQNLNEKLKIINKFESALSKFNKEINFIKEEKKKTLIDSFEILEIDENEEKEKDDDEDED